MGKGTNRTVRRLGYLGMRRRRRRPWCMSDGLGAASRVWYFGRLLLKCGSALSPTEDRTGIPGAARIHSGVFSWDLCRVNVTSMRRIKGNLLITERSLFCLDLVVRFIATSQKNKRRDNSSPDRTFKGHQSRLLLVGLVQGFT
ncbi:hypothetical protein WAI453_002239 [Rhynchosporium graminicola]